MKRAGTAAVSPTPFSDRVEDGALCVHDACGDAQHDRLAVPRAHGGRGRLVGGQMDVLPRARLEARRADGLQETDRGAVEGDLGWRHRGEAEVDRHGMTLARADACPVLAEREALLRTGGDDAVEVLPRHGGPLRCTRPEQRVHGDPAGIVERETEPTRLMAEHQGQELAEVDVARAHGAAGTGEDGGSGRTGSPMSLASRGTIVALASSQPTPAARRATAGTFIHAAPGGMCARARSIAAAPAGATRTGYGQWADRTRVVGAHHPAKCPRARRHVRSRGRDAPRWRVTTPCLVRSAGPGARRADIAGDGEPQPADFCPPREPCRTVLAPAPRHELERLYVRSRRRPAARARAAATTPAYKPPCAPHASK